MASMIAKELRNGRIRHNRVRINIARALVGTRSSVTSRTTCCPRPGDRERRHPESRLRQGTGLVITKSTALPSTLVHKPRYEITNGTERRIPLHRLCSAPNHDKQQHLGAQPHPKDCITKGCEGHNLGEPFGKWTGPIICSRCGDKYIRNFIHYVSYPFFGCDLVASYNVSSQYLGLQD